MTQNEFSTLCQKCFDRNSLSEFTDETTISIYYKMVSHMLEVNEVMNLTAITDPREIVIKHLADSLTVAQFLPKNASVLDVGCGGGFPSLPLAIARPDLTITALDSTAKKTQYVFDTASLLGLSNLSTLTGRAEDCVKDNNLRERFDATVARAVASLSILSELCLPFVRVGGIMVAMKGKFDQTEHTKAPELLGGTSFECYSFDLLGLDQDEKRNVLISNKRSRTPERFPRSYAQIKSKPL